MIKQPPARIALNLVTSLAFAGMAFAAPEPPAAEKPADDKAAAEAEVASTGRIAFEDGKLRAWRSVETAEVIDGVLIALEGDNITLLIGKEREVTLPLSHFHADDKSYVEAMKKDQLEIDQWRAEKAKAGEKADEKKKVAFPTEADNADEKIRTYTAVSGQTIKAEVLAVKNGTATLRMEGNRTYDIPLERLSEADRTYLTAWGEKNPSYGLNDLRFEVRKDSEKTADSANSKTYSVKWVGTLSNNTREEITDVTIAYTVYKRKSSRGEGATDDEISVEEHVTQVGALPGGEKFEFESDAIAESVTSIPANKKKNIKSSSSSDRIEGVIFTVKVKESEISTYSEPRGFVDRLKRELAQIEEKKAREEARRAE